MAEEDSFIDEQIGNYQIIAKIDSGTFGTVYKAQHTILEDRIVAVKLLHARFRSQKDRDQFFHEAKLLAKLKHSHVLPVLDAGIFDGVAYIVTEYAPNGSLRTLIDGLSPHPLSMERAIAILTQIGQALHYAHQQNVVHRDLKPENILFNAKDEALLADFGIALTLETTKHADVRGTPAYMAPEQFRGEVSKKSDQYALGCIAYELMTGRKVFVDPNFYSMAFKHLNEYPPAPTQFNPLVPVHIEQAIFKAILKDRSERHKDILTFIAALEKSPEKWLDEADNFFSLERYEEALAACEQAMRLEPKNVRAYRYKAAFLYWLKRYEEELVVLDQLLDFSPSDETTYFSKAITLKELRRYEEALRAYEQRILIDSHDIVAYFNKSELLKELRRYEEALRAYEQVIHLDPKHEAAYYGKGVVLEQLGRLKEAQRFYAKAKRLGF